MGEAAPTPPTTFPKLAQHEPWRWGRVRVERNEDLCTGEVDWEPGTGWWLCKECGHVGSAPYFGHYPTRFHRPAPKFKHIALLAGAALLGVMMAIGSLLKRR
jgi:hypothetical protein